MKPPQGERFHEGAGDEVVTAAEADHGVENDEQGDVKGGQVGGDGVDVDKD